MDQAQGLRLHSDAAINKTYTPRVISVTSGKGGVGKTNMAINMATSFAARGKKTLLVDADFGLANANILLNIRPTATLEDVLHSDRRLEEIFVSSRYGFDLLPSGCGLRTLFNLDSFTQRTLFDRLQETFQQYDYVIYDTAPGIGNHVLDINASAHEIVVVTLPDPMALADTYALIKVLAAEKRQKKFRLIVNRVKNPTVGLEIYRKLGALLDEFLSISIDYMGCVPEDAVVGESILTQKPVLALAPRSSFSIAVQRLCDKLLATSSSAVVPKTWNNESRQAILRGISVP